MAFGPDGNLYISGGTFGGNLGVRRYNPTTGAFIDFFANTGSDLYVPIGITFGPDNNLYVATQSRCQCDALQLSSRDFHGLLRS